MAKDKKKKSGKIAIVVSRFNEEVTGGLLKGAISCLTENGYDEKELKIIFCPGAFEIPLTAKHLCRTGRYCGIICLGAVIKGETAHFEYISHAVTQGIMLLNVEFEIPVSYGVLTCYTDEQAICRSSDNPENKGREAAGAVLDMIKLLKEI
jgi:6,7-dimethyl-8-ribityllumazine synthase